MKTAIITMALLLAATPALATTYDDNDTDALLGQSSLEILDVEVTSDGTQLTTVWSIQDLRSNQPGTRYALHYGDNEGREISIDCHLGFGIVVLQSGQCDGSHEVFSPVSGVAQVVAIPVNYTFDLTANTITVSVAYSDFGDVSGDQVNVGIWASLLMVGNQGLVVGDRLDLDEFHTLA